MNRSERIKEKIEATFKPLILQIEDESSRHGRGNSKETHFRCTIVSSSFQGVRRLQRERSIYELLKGELNTGLHALSLSLFTPEEWENLSTEQKISLSSPPCPSKIRNK
jgi:BolA protein